jgi:uncharacterized protein (TIGR02246 family)
MKIRLLLTLAGFAIGFVLPTFAQQKDTADARIAQQHDLIGDPKALDEFGVLARKQEEAFTNKDAAAVAALFTEDAVFVTHSGTLYGRQAIEKFYADEFKAWHNKNFDRTIDPNSYRIIGTADNVASNGGWSFTAQAEGGEPFPIKGCWSAIHTREGDVWKICMLTWNITPAPAETK